MYRCSSANLTIIYYRRRAATIRARKKKQRRSNLIYIAAVINWNKWTLHLQRGRPRTCKLTPFLAQVGVYFIRSRYPRKKRSTPAPDTGPITLGCIIFNNESTKETLEIYRARFKQ